MALSRGTRLGAYEIAAQIGVGGMGEVYRALDTHLARHVAIKVLPESMATDADRLARFDREAKTLAALNHPNIAAVYGLEKSDGRTALIMELVEGPTLADRAALGPIPVDEALSIAKQIAEALEAAHELGIVHRDLKPANVKVRPDGTVKVLDFGLAKALGPEGGQTDLSHSPTVMSPAVTGTGVILGTAAYMAPEQATGKTADKRSDVWAFGVVLYEMLTGISPFAADTTVEVLSKVLTSEPDWTALPRTTPVAIRSLLKRCLQRDRGRRLRDVADARFQIEEAIQESGPVTTVAPVRDGRRERLLWMAVLVAVAIVVAAMTRSLTVEPRIDQVRLEINTPPTTQPTSIALSPDGGAIAFAAISDGKERLWIRSLRDGSTRVLAATDDVRYPFWSPDSRSIGFFADTQLKRIDLETGAIQTLGVGTFGGAWNSDETILFTADPSSPLYRIPAAGGQPYAVTETNAQTANHRFPQLLPDGRHFIYYATGTAPGIYVGQLDSHETRRLVDADAAKYTESGYLLFVRQGALFAQPFDRDRLELIGKPITVEQQIVVQSGVAALSTSVGGSIVYRPRRLNTERQLIWVDRTGKELERVPGSGWTSGVSVSLSRDARTVAFDQLLGGTTDIWLLSLARGVPTRLTSHPDFDLYPVWSPDGKRIAFQSSRKSRTGSVFDTYVRSVNGTGNEELLVGGEDGQLPTDWSPDGKFVLYDDLAKGIWAVGADGDGKPFPVVETNVGATGGQFSPDGRWVAYQSRESGGKPEIFVQRFPGPGGKSQVSAEGGVQVRWRGDGRELFYLAPDNRLMAVPIRLDSSGEAVEVGVPSPLFAARLSGSPQRRTNRQYMVSPDGQRFLIDSPAEVTIPITVLLNWKPKS